MIATLHRNSQDPDAHVDVVDNARFVLHNEILYERVSEVDFEEVRYYDSRKTMLVGYEGTRGEWPLDENAEATALRSQLEEHVAENQRLQAENAELKSQNKALQDSL